MDFNSIDSMFDEEIIRCLKEASESPIEGRVDKHGNAVAGGVHGAAIDAAIKMYQARLQHDTEANAQSIEDTKIQLDAKKHKEYMELERQKLRVSREKDWLDSGIIVFKALMFTMLGGAAFNADNKCKIVSKGIVSTMGRIIN